MQTRRLLNAALGLSPLAFLAACATPPSRPPPSAFDRRTTAEAPPHPRVAELLFYAIGLVGVPYRFGGNDIDNGFDCSGLTRHLFVTHLGITLPRRSHEQAGAAGFDDVPGFELQPGDLVFFNTLQRANSHVGVYIGGARFIHAPRTGALVRLEPMRLAYWLSRYDGGRRLSSIAAP